MCDDRAPKSCSNERVFTLTELEFVDKIYLKEYSTFIQKSLREINKYLKKHNIKDVDSII